MLKVLYTGLQKENYSSKRGWSFEYNNFFLTLKNMSGVTLIEHSFDRILEVGKKQFNQELLALVERESPDLLFAFMYTNELDPEVLRRIRDRGATTTLAWFADDYWRFWNYSRHWAPHFDWAVTTYSRAMNWYRQAGITNVLQSQWACNTAIFKPVDISQDIDVSFVGQYKPGRARIIKILERAGIAVRTFGFGWPGGRVSREEMLNIFSRSKINLNINERPGLTSPRVLARLFLKKSVNRVIPDFHLWDNFRSYLHFSTPHTHARPFELAGCGAFVISGDSEDIGQYYYADKEMVFYNSPGELIQKVNYYLNHNTERTTIAQGGYVRTLAQHTYPIRLHTIFEQIGLIYE